jgi:hypothetical protein
VHITRDGAVATISLDLSINWALSPREHQALQRILAELRAGFETRVVISPAPGARSRRRRPVEHARGGQTAQRPRRRHRARIGDPTVAAIDALTGCDRGVAAASAAARCWRWPRHARHGATRGCRSPGSRSACRSPGARCCLAWSDRRALGW